MEVLIIKVNNSYTLFFIMLSLVLLCISFSNPVSAATWTIDEPDNGMTTNEHIQNIINNAQSGDTILFTGTQYSHIHLSIDKPLNIISNVGTQLYACPLTAPLGSDNLTAFAIYNGASGTNISGFKINNNNLGYGIILNNTTNINISNNVITCDNGTGINIFNCQEVTVNNNTLSGSNSGMKLSNSNLTSILNNLIKDNNENGILFGQNVSSTLIMQNNISSNNYIGINLLESCSNVTIQNNYISLNYNRNNGEGRGIYINTPIFILNITGNFIYKNGNLGICDDIGVNEGNNFTENTQNIENNFICGQSFRNVVRYFDDNGTLVRKEVWIKETCFGGIKNLCPSAHLSGEAIMSNISQVSPGKYSVSFIDKATGVNCTGFGSFYITFFLNKNDTTKSAIDVGDIWKEVLVRNGTANVDFSNYTYKESNNTIFAIAPFDNFASAMKNTLNVNNADIPKLSLSSVSSVSKSILKNGETVIYRVTVKNNNTRDATGVKVSNILSSNYYTSSATPTQGSYSNGVWNIGTLKAGESLSISINAKAKKSGKVASKATVTGSNINTVSSNALQTTITKDIKMSYSNSVSSTKVKKNKYVYLTSKVRNSGKDRSNTVKVKITLPKGMKLVSVNYPSVYDKKTKTWTFTVPSGKAYSFKVKAKVTSKGTKKITFNINGKNYYKYIKGY